MGKVARWIITTASAPTPIVHYCQGVVAGDTVYAAGQIASEARDDPAFPFYGSEIQHQARYILNNLRTTFTEVGCTRRPGEVPGLCHRPARFL